MNKRALALIRGPNLNKWDMQTYELLSEKYDITAYTTHTHNFNIDEINLPIKKLHSLDLFKSNSSSLISRGFSFITYLSGYSQYMFGLEKELSNFDIVHTSEIFNGYSSQVLKAKEKFGFKMIVTVWENIPFSPEQMLTDTIWTKIIRQTSHHKHHLRNEIINKADLFIAITERAKFALMLEGVTENKIEVLPAGINLKIFNRGKKNGVLLGELGLTENDFIILFIGRLVYEKGVYDLIYAAKMLVNDEELKGKRIKFLLVGNGPEKKRLNATIQTLQLSRNVMLLGSYPYNKMPQLHNMADIFILPSIPTRWGQEQFGMVLIEAFASGTPVISTFCGSIPEVVGDAGVLTQANDPLSLYQNMKRLIQDGQLRDELKIKGRQRALDRFDAGKISERLEQIYSEI